MNAHDTDYIRVFIKRIRLAVVNFLAVQAVDVAQELEQSRKVCLCKGICLAAQKPQIGGPLRPRGKCRAVILKTGLLQKACDDLRDGTVLHAQTPSAQKSQKIRTFPDKGLRKSRAFCLPGGSCICS